MIKLDFEMPKNTFECPFLEEDTDSVSWCYFAPQVEKRCIGLFKGECPIIREEDSENSDASRLMKGLINK